MVRGNLSEGFVVAICWLEERDRAFTFLFCRFFRLLSVACCTLLLPSLQCLSAFGVALRVEKGFHHWSFTVFLSLRYLAPSYCFFTTLQSGFRTQRVSLDQGALFLVIVELHPRPKEGPRRLYRFYWWDLPDHWIAEQVLLREQLDLVAEPLAKVHLLLLSFTLLGGFGATLKSPFLFLFALLFRMRWWIEASVEGKQRLLG